MDMSWISFHIQKDTLSYPKRYLFISKKISFHIQKDILEIFSIRDISRYLKISHDISRYLFGANFQMYTLLSVSMRTSWDRDATERGNYRIGRM
jgi:hypothetical protein